MVHYIVLLFILVFSIQIQAQQPIPWQPAIRDRVEAASGGQYHHPVIPSFRTTEDGRVAINNKTIGSNVEFYIIAPEKINTSFLKSPNGPSILATATPFRVNEKNINNIGLTDFNITHTTVCDPTRQFYLSRERNNPFVCGNSNSDDCYDLELISTVITGGRAQLWQTPIRVRVTNPKTANARIAAVTRRGNSFRGSMLNGARTFFEPIVAGEDKRLLIGRVGNSRIRWTDANGSSRGGDYDIVYARSSSSYGACDTRGFRQLYPISHAPYDPAINRKYGFAKNRFRDPMGNPIADGVEIGGTYPWIDKKANNFVMMGIPGSLYNYDSGSQTVKTRYPTRCATSGCLQPRNQSEIRTVESPGDVKGYIFTGLWTHGKMVYMDTPIQPTNYGTKGHDSYHREIQIYRGGPNNGFVRIGYGRDNANTGLPAYTQNSSFFESFENLYNHLPNMKPRSPRDVVWLISSGVRTHEFAFDDYINEDVLINSPMNAALERNRGRMWIHDGFDSTRLEFTGPVRLQNAATSKKWRIPRYASVMGPGRVEPVPLGGAHAKGFWFQGNTRLQYQIPNQSTSTTNKHWYIGMYLDPRFDNDTTPREILRFPNGDQIRLFGTSGLIFRKSNGHQRRVDFGQVLPRRQWSHLGLQITPNGRWVQIFINGFHANTYKNTQTSVPAFRIQSGQLRLGAKFYGWMDEFKVIHGRFNHEEKCNYADGSLLALASDYTGPLRTIANRYPARRHRQVRDAVRGNGYWNGIYNAQQFVCQVDYTSVDHADTHYTPRNTFSVKQALLFPEGPLIFNQRRPSSENNTFCLRCHTSDGLGGLDIDALVVKNPFQEMDGRRQPMQALRRIFGNIPANYLNNRWSFQTGNGGYRLDRYMHPAQ